MWVVSYKRLTICPQKYLDNKKSARRDSNPRPRPWQGRAPPTEPLAHKRVMGIEPTYPAWKAGVLPLNYTRRLFCFRFLSKTSDIILHGNRIVNSFLKKIKKQNFQYTFKRTFSEIKSISGEK